MSDRLLVLGDVHGAARALTQVLDRANFDPASDHLVFLGDACDGWSETPEAIDILLSIPSLTALIGNHDEWFLEWVLYNKCVPEWWHQGGRETIQAYDPHLPSWLAANSHPHSVPSSHEWYLRTALFHHVEWDTDVSSSLCFVHGGHRPNMPVEARPPGGWTWDRALWQAASEAVEGDTVTPYHRTFIGHTSTASHSLDPVFRAGVWNLDQGAGWGGKLTLMDAHTEDYWQSSLVSSLYPDEAGRRRSG